MVDKRKVHNMKIVSINDAPKKNEEGLEVIDFNEKRKQNLLDILEHMKAGIEAGEITDPKVFPEVALEAAKEREQNDPNNLGVEGPAIQAFNRGDGKTAKEMLEQKKMVVETDE